MTVLDPCLLQSHIIEMQSSHEAKDIPIPQSNLWTLLPGLLRCHDLGPDERLCQQPDECEPRVEDQEGEGDAEPHVLPQGAMG